MSKQAFSVGNIVHVAGTNAHTSTGEVVDVVDNHGMGWWYDVDFKDGEVTSFMKDDLRLATDAELTVYLTHHDQSYIDEVLAQQPFSIDNAVTIDKPGHPMHGLPAVLGHPYSDSTTYNVRLENSSINAWLDIKEVRHRLSIPDSGDWLQAQQQNDTQPYPTPQFNVGDQVLHEEYGYGVVEEKHTEEEVPYYSVKFASGDTSNCDGFELEVANDVRLDQYDEPVAFGHLAIDRPMSISEHFHADTGGQLDF
jgi:hypothetical protein